MIQLALGLLVFAVTHLFRRLAPARRAAMGDPAKGAVAVLSVIGVVLMARGYGAWDGAPVLWAGPDWLRYVNNVLVLLAFYLFAASGMRTRAARLVRHPQLTAVILWATAHLLVNGDAASLLLFGGLLIWAVLEILLINRAEPAWTPPSPASPGKEAGAVLGTVAAVVVVGLIHGWIGPWPFGA